MLQKIRDRITGWIAGIVLAMLAVAFVFWGIDFGIATRDYAATVDGDEIPLTQFRTAFQNRLNQFQQYYQDEIPDSMRAQVRDTVLEDMVRNTLLRRRAESGGYRVSDTAVRESIEALPVFQVGGEFSKDIYYARLRSQGLSAAAFEAEQRSLLELTQLQDAILRTAFATTAELERDAELEQEQREMAYAVFSAEQYRDGVTVDDAAIEAYYRENPDEFRSPETVTLNYVQLRAEELAGDSEVSETELEELYANTPERFETPEQRRARHVLIQIDDDTEAQEARDEAAQVLERARAGDDFAALAREHSDDTGTAQSGGDLEWVERGMFTGPFDEALFSMEPGEIRGPVRSEYGFHVIKLEEIRAGERRAFDEVRDELEAELKAEKADERFYERAQALADAAFETPGELESVAEELDLELRRIPDFSREAGGGDIGADPVVIAAAFDDAVLIDGENSPILELGEDHVMVVRVSDHQPSVVLPLDAVRDRISDLLRSRAAQQKAAGVGDDFRARVAGGADPGELAEELGAEFHAARFVGRTEQSLPTMLLADAFRAPRPVEGKQVVRGVTLNDGDYAVYLLSVVRPGDFAALAEAERESRRRQLAQRRGTGDFAAYVEDLRAEAKVKVNKDIEEDLEAP
ncbi:MAG TPA: SurA N-terminal domain-containing protein [Gammaproteobacteria bacterium]|nr:SurA N-terminal domain-containing protein [Gammaproteobacteria bacterium]